MMIINCHDVFACEHDHDDDEHNDDEHDDKCDDDKHGDDVRLRH